MASHIWIRLDTYTLELANTEVHPDHGEWIEAGKALRIIREHNERAAREEQGPDWIRDVADELARARKKFPGTDLLTTAFAEEAGERVKAILDNYNGKASDIYTEAIQTIAMVVRLLEEGDPVHRLKPIASMPQKPEFRGIADTWAAETAFEEVALQIPDGPPSDDIDQPIPYVPTECHGKFLGEPSPGAKVDPPRRPVRGEPYLASTADLILDIQEGERIRERIGSLPGSGPHLAAKVQEIQEGAIYPENAVPDVYEIQAGAVAPVPNPDSVDVVRDLQQREQDLIARCNAYRDRIQELEACLGKIPELNPAIRGAAMAKAFGKNFLHVHPVAWSAFNAAWDACVSQFAAFRIGVIEPATTNETSAP